MKSAPPARDICLRLFISEPRVAPTRPGSYCAGRHLEERSGKAARQTAGIFKQRRRPSGSFLSDVGAQRRRGVWFLCGAERFARAGKSDCENVIKLWENERQRSV